MIAEKAIALAIPGALCALALGQAPAPVTEPADWTRSVSFDAYELPSAGSDPATIRRVHPDYEGISAWISSVGASVALFDRDGDGIANDYCLVDPRFDSVTVAPVPTTGDRYAPLRLDWDEGGAAPGTVAPMGCLPADLDGDGRQDLVVYYWGRAPSLHLAAEGHAGRPLLRDNEIWNTNAAIVADINGDDLPDLVFGNYFPDGLEVLGTEGTARLDSVAGGGGSGRRPAARALRRQRFRQGPPAAQPQP